MAPDGVDFEGSGDCTRATMARMTAMTEAVMMMKAKVKRVKVKRVQKRAKRSSRRLMAMRAIPKAVLSVRIIDGSCWSRLQGIWGLQPVNIGLKILRK